MKQKGQTLSRKQVAAAKRQAILSSKIFEEWWTARRHIHPIPSDPYRAFMIDKSLKAKPLPKELWTPRTNRSDILADYPSHLPAFKVRPMSRKQLARLTNIPKAALPEPKHPFEKVLHEHLEKMAEHYHVPMPIIKAEQSLGSVGAGHYQPSGVFLGKPYLQVGIKGIKKKKPEEYGKGGKWEGAEAQVLASAKHEMGHHISAHGHVAVPEAHFEQLKKLQESPEFKGKRISWNATQREELQAWSLGDAFMHEIRPVQKYRRRIMIGTYLDTTPEFSYEFGEMRGKKK